MKDGGYYKYKISSDVSVLVLNSIYFSVKNNEDLTSATNQLDWIEAQLSAGTATERFLFSMHIPPTLFSFLELDDFWQPSFKSRFLSILSTYHSRILMVLGAHIHQGDIRAPTPSTTSNPLPPIYLTPSVSPIFLNNPGYSVLTL
jgi:hypothetical protein